MNEKLKRILKRKAEIRAKLQANVEGTIELTEEDIKALQGELEDLNKEEEAAVEEAEQEEQRNRANGMTDIVNRGNSGNSLRKILQPGEEPEETQERTITKEEMKKRGKELKEQRAITVGSSEIALKKHTAEGVNKTFNEVSTLVDLVKVVPLNGGETYERGYVVSHGEGGDKDEDGNYKDAETKFAYATINKQEVTAYQEQPKAIKKLADEDYSREVIDGVGIAIRKKLSKDIMTGPGTNGKIQGIFTNPPKFAIDSKTDLEISKIDEDTLDDIVYSYGGEEDVQNDACLILNKLDLKAFKKVRYPDGKKVYDIVSKGNTGTIDGVPYVLNSACNPLSGKNTEVGKYCMAYGSLSNYELAVFSDIEVEESNDYKFKQGQIAHRGEGFFGGNVTAYNGFIRVKKAAVATVEETKPNTNQDDAGEI